jgi:hypothetical protein
MLRGVASCRLGLAAKMVAACFEAILSDMQQSQWRRYILPTIC